ncbi:MAG: serine/threonine protein kinase [Planctomycetota bacterium]|nr:MAG: serine/threonine protein kinase [Planctomycetota bacterium]
MAEKSKEVRVGVALVGPEASGKARLLQALHAASTPEGVGPLTRLDALDGRVLLYDHAEFRLGNVGSLPLYVDLYVLPGDPAGELARRIVFSTCEGFIVATDRSASYTSKCKGVLAELRAYLAERRRTFEEAALVGLLTDGGRRSGSDSGSNRLEVHLRAALGDDRVLSASVKNSDGIAEALRKVTAQVLSREREALEARRRGEPPVRQSVPDDLARDIEAAHQLYLRRAGVEGADFSPHSERFLGEIFLELGGTTPEELVEASELRAQAGDLGLGVDLAEVMVKRELLDPDVARRGKRIQRCVEVIHEEVVWGRVAAELGVVPFDRIKRALLMQTRRLFQHSLQQLLLRARQLDRAGRQRILAEQQRRHEAELERDRAQELERQRTGTRSWESQSGSGVRRLPLFGQVAVNLGLVTPEQLDECIAEQRELRKRGARHFLGALLRRKGYLSEEEIPLVCKALEAEISADRIKGYEILKSLGRGNMALVFAARQLNLDRIVALKVLDPKLLFDADFITRFVEEARAAARLNHPNIVQAYDVGSSDDLHYFAMEFVDGVTVRDLIDEPGFLDEATTIDVAVQIARALGHAAGHQLVHRDVKPANIMITREGVAKLCDLGLAKRIDQTSETEGVILGSPYYISPEQIEGRADIDTRADIYSLGATLFHMLTGRPPFKGRTPEDVCLKHLSEPIPDPTQLSSSVTQRITPVLFKMMAKDRRYRYRDFAEVVRDLLLLRGDAASDDRLRDLSARIRETYPAPTRRWKNS